MMRYVRFVLAATLAVWAGATCVTTQEGEKMRARIAKLERQHEETKKRLEKQQEKLQTKIKEANTEVEELRSVLKKAKKLLQRNNADLGAELKETRKRIQSLRGQIEETQFRMRRLQQELEIFKKEVQEGTMVGELPEKPDELFEFGEKKLEAGDLPVARKAFETFKEKFSNDSRVPEAQLRLGDIHFRNGKWVSAIVDYRKIMKQYSDSAHVPKATYRIGVAFMRMGKCEDAKPFLETVMADHGESPYADKAIGKLESIEKGECSR